MTRKQNTKSFCVLFYFSFFSPLLTFLGSYLNLLFLFIQRWNNICMKERRIAKSTKKIFFEFCFEIKALSIFLLLLHSSTKESREIWARLNFLAIHTICCSFEVWIGKKKTNFEFSFFPEKVFIEIEKDLSGKSICVVKCFAHEV